MFVGQWAFCILTVSYTVCRWPGWLALCRLARAKHGGRDDFTRISLPEPVVTSG